MRKQPTFRDATTGFPAKWRLRNERWNSILVTCHYPDLGNALPFDWSCRGGNLLQPIRLQYTVKKKKTEPFIFHSYFFLQTALVDFADATLVSRTTLFILNEKLGFLFNHDTLEFLHYTTPLATVVSKCPLKRGGGKSEVKTCNTVNPTYKNLKLKNLSGWNFHFKHPSHRTISGWNFKVGS